jgi:hypothetical protein
MNEWMPLTRPSATLSPLRGARGSRHESALSDAERSEAESKGAAKRRMRAGDQ